MLERTCTEARAVAGVQVELCASPGPSSPGWDGNLPAGIAATDQGPGELGERLARAAARVICAGEAPILIGTDCPALDRSRLGAACRALADHDAFIHPTEDGGYALLALRRFSPLLFSEIAWSGPSVAAETISRLRQLGWHYCVGDVLRDVDEPADYHACFGAPPAA